MTSVTVVGDESAITDIAQCLIDAGHEVLVRHDATSGYAAALRGCDAMIISQRLPDMRGTELCRLVRANELISNTLVVIVMEVDSEIDRVVAFELGADDVAARPLSLREFALRVRALMRRKAQPRRSSAPASGELTIDTEGHRVLVRGRQVVLSALEMRLLVAIYRSRGLVRTRQQLLQKVWAGKRNVSERTVDACVKRLRTKLGSAGRLVETVRSVGYRFASPGPDSSRGFERAEP